MPRAFQLPFYAFLLTAYPVLLYFSENLEEGVAASDMLPPLVVALVVTIIGYLGLWLPWRDSARAAIVVCAVVAPCLLFGPLVDAIHALWPHSSIVRSQLAALLVWVVTILLATSIAARAGDRLERVTEALNVAALVLVLLVAVPTSRFVLWPDGATTTAQSGATGAALAQSTRRHAESMPDIYHLVFDRYGSESSLRAGFGIDNSEFVGWLEEQGFKIVHDARANYWRTLPSLSSMFRMALLDDIAVEMGPDNPNPGPLRELLRNNPAAATLQELGYTYIHLGSWYREFTTSDIADYVRAPDYQVDFGSVVFENTAVPVVQGLLAVVAATEPRVALGPRANATLEQFQLVESMFALEGPKLVYAHFLVPHPPYMFLEDGTIDPQRATFESQLGFTNTQIRRLVEPLLSKPDGQKPIIILQADEGPLPTRCEDEGPGCDWTTAADDELLAKFGVLSAWYLPGPEGLQPIPSGSSLVNTYPEILRRYFGIDVPRSPDRSYASREGRIYDHVDITERLKGAEARSSE